MGSLARTNALGSTVGTIELEAPNRAADHFANAWQDAAALALDTAYENTAATAVQVVAGFVASNGTSAFGLQESADGVNNWIDAGSATSGGSTAVRAAGIIRAGYFWRVHRLAGAGIISSGAFNKFRVL